MRSLTFLLLFVWSSAAYGQVPDLSPAAEVSVITCGPTQEELYAAFGHSAIRVFDPVRGIDFVYNYGVFDFSQPNFYLNYTKGLLLFKLGVYPYQDFKDYYIYFNRSVTEQVINLSSHQKQQLFQYLEHNALPENQSYRYDYFYNNCASKVRDVFKDVLGDSIRFDSTFIQTHYTIRQLTDLYLVYQPWGDLGIDICLGSPIDKVARPYEYMFLPDYIESSFDHASIVAASGTHPLVKRKVNVFVSNATPPPFSPLDPWVVLGAFGLLTAGLTWRDFRRKKIARWFDAALFGVVGLVGCLLMVLWTATDHAAAAGNYNLLWAVPLHLLVPVAIVANKRFAVRKYATVTLVILVIVLIGWKLLPQQLNVHLIPVLVVIGLRCWVWNRLAR